MISNKKLLVTALASVVLMATAGCERAISNMQVMISDDCGENWKKVPNGKVVPARVGPCALKTTIPGYPMSGDATFRTAFANRVLVGVNIGYEYQITTPEKFLTEARYLGRANSEGDGAENTTDRYESAENTIINRRIREVTASTLINQSIVEFDQARVEDQLLEAINKQLESRGVELVSMAFVVTPDDQTRQAMDVASARQVYTSVGLGELGDRLLVARAGATNITINEKASSQ